MANKNSSKDTPKSDERNVVGADQVDIQDIEDKVFMIWEKNKGLIFGGIAFIFAIFIGYQGLKFMEQRAEANLKEGYTAASESGDKASWAEDESGKPLGGFAFKELGDESYLAGDFAKAEEYYRKAAEAAESPVDQAANIALAVSLIAQDKTAEAKSVLQPIANNDNALAQAEAQYRLASLASKEGDNESARSLIEAIDEQAFFWKSRAESIAKNLPEA